MSTFEIQNRSRSGISVLDLQGELDAHTAPELEKAFQSLMNDKQFQIIVNGSGLEYISSAGLGVFMAYIEDIRTKKGDIKIAGLKPKVYNVFDLLGFPTLYDITDSEEQAFQKFQKPSE